DDFCVANAIELDTFDRHAVPPSNFSCAAAGVIRTLHWSAGCRCNDPSCFLEDCRQVLSEICRSESSQSPSSVRDQFLTKDLVIPDSVDTEGNGVRRLRVD